nr:hypothetical protein [uncultured Prevotella sp.]
MKINIVKEDRRVKTAHEEFLKQNPFFEQEEEEKKKDSDLKGCFIIILSLCICMLYSTSVWIFDWHEGILALIEIILLNGWFIILFLAALWSVLIKREKQLIGMIVLLGYGVFVFIFSFPNFYNASFDLITGETQITEGTFIMCQGRRSYGTYHIVFDGKHDMVSSDRLQINDATHDMLLNAHIIRVKHWKRSGVIQSVEIISKKTSSDCIKIKH